MIRKYIAGAFQLLLLTPISTGWSSAQEIFDLSLLNAPSKNGGIVADKFTTTEVYEYEAADRNCVILRNGFRKHGFVNAKDWLSIKDSVVVSKVQIVFSKYPIRNGTYNEIYPLLFNRIKATIALDPALNNTNIVWERVWQTHCENNVQVDQLFHGVVIHYDVPEKDNIKDLKKEAKDQVLKNEIVQNKEQKVPTKSTKKEAKKMSPVLEYMLNHPTTPESLRQTAKDLSTEEAERLILNYYREEAKSQPDGPITNPAVQLNYMYELEVFARQFPESDTIVGQVLDRHPEWNSKIIVNDWTGSMYGYGSQVILWHLMNLETSGISTVTLFNDGDKKPTKRKKIGKTKGIYTAEANNPSELLDLFNSVMLKGGGGDGPENDVEAILKAVDKAPEAEVILIADNSACVRDISLAHKIGRPVRIILCGYNPEEGVNPDYVYLANITNGGIYTLEEDLENLNAQVDENGSIVGFDEKRFKLSSPQCFEDVFYAAAGRQYPLKKARWNKKDVRVLDASNLRLQNVPKYVYKMPNLQSLDLSKNFLVEIEENIGNLPKLSELNLNNNTLSTLPKTLEQNRFIEHLYLNNNQFNTLPESIYGLNFLQALYAHNNQLKSLEAFDSKVLLLLDVSKNQLSALPSLTNQEELMELNASNNQLSEFPSALPKKLEILDVSFNNISQLPDDLTPYINLKELNLQGNPISTGERIRIRQALFNVDLTF
ncbi:MAG: hypothetical protein Crog4KO_03080 [Crocinitomicaceae bacterium]